MIDAQANQPVRAGKVGMTSARRVVYKHTWRWRRRAATAPGIGGGRGAAVNDIDVMRDDEREDC